MVLPQCLPWCVHESAFHAPVPASVVVVHIVATASAAGCGADASYTVAGAANVGQIPCLKL